MFSTLLPSYLICSARESRQRENLNVMLNIAKKYRFSNRLHYTSIKLRHWLSCVFFLLIRTCYLGINHLIMWYVSVNSKICKYNGVKILSTTFFRGIIVFHLNAFDLNLVSFNIISGYGLKFVVHLCNTEIYRWK